MNAVGKVGTFFAQSVYTVSGPFHPFGGAVDIIVVQQEDGTFKSSPWYVKFGKFQGVLKRREKKVVVAVNDGDASFHMYLDHKGEAYFLKDAVGDEVGTFSPPEAVSSGDENASHMLALEYSREEEGAHPREEQLGKEESEDEKEEYLELRFKGRDASKLLIQQAVVEQTTASGLVGETIKAAERNSVDSSEDLRIPESSTRVEEFSTSSNQEPPTTAQPKAASHGRRREGESSNGKVIHALLNKAVRLEAGVKSTPAIGILANAAFEALQSQASPTPDDRDVSPQEEFVKAPATEARRSLSKNGVVIHGLLNQAIGLQPSHPSGPASGLIATAILASLHKAVSDPQTEDGSLKRPQLLELDGDDMDVQKYHEDTWAVSRIGELKEQENPVLDSVANPNAEAAAAGSFRSRATTSASVMETASSLGSLSGLSEIDSADVEDPILSGLTSPSRTSQFIDVRKRLEVTKLEILDKTLVVEVQEHIEKDQTLGSLGSEEQKEFSGGDRRVESIVVDRRKVMDKVHDLQVSSGQDGPVGDISSQDADKLESVHEQDVIPEDVAELVTVHVDKVLVENLQDALAQTVERGSTIILEKEKVMTASHKEVELINSQNAQVAQSPEVKIGQDLLLGSGESPSATSDDVPDNSARDISTPEKELTSYDPTVSDVGSPLRKAALEQEIAWREVMDKAATTLKGAPYTSGKLNHSQSYKKKGFENGEKKSDSPGRLTQQSERKTWGGWLWGGSSAPQSKGTGEQGSSKNGKVIPPVLGEDPRDLDSGGATLRNRSGLTSESKDVSKSGILTMQNVEGSDGNVEAEGKGAQSESDSGQTEVRKSVTDNLVGRGKPKDQSEFNSDNKGQEKLSDGPPPRRRTLFGLLSRTNTNQSSLSNASSFQSNDDLHLILDGLNKEISLGKGQNVVDLLEETWTKGSEARRTRVGSGRITKLEHESKVGGEILEGGNVGAPVQDASLNSETSEGTSPGSALQSVEGTSNLRASADLEGHWKGVGSNHSQNSSILDVTGLETEVAHLGGTPDEDSRMITTRSGQGGRKDGNLEAEDEDGNRQVIEAFISGSDRGTILDNNTGHLSSSDMDVVLMSIDGHPVRAPVGQGDTEDLPFVDNSEKLKKSLSSPQKLVCFSGVSDDGSSRAAAHRLASFTVQKMMSTQVSDSVSDGLKRQVLADCSDGKPANPGYEGLKGLVKLIENDCVGEAHENMGSFHSQSSKIVPLESAPDQLGSCSESVETLEINAHKEIDVDATDPNEFNDIRAMVLENFDKENEGDSLETDQERLERYYSSKDLTEAEEEEEMRPFKRNLSVYMDAISGEDEQDSSGSADDHDLDQSRDKSGPIGIPGPLVQRFSTEKVQMLRTASESLPNARSSLVNLDTVSPRLALSRSLDSATPSVLSPATKELSASSDSVLTTRLSPRCTLQGLEMAEVNVVDITPENVMGDAEQLSGGTYKPGTQISIAACSSSGNTDEGASDPETGFELSLCRHLLKERMGLDAAAKVFASEKVTLQQFKNSGSSISANDKLVVRVGGRYYPWMVAAPIVLGILAFGQVLIAPNEGAIPVEQPVVVFEGKSAANRTPAGGGWKLWPFGAIRRPKTPERALLSREAMMVATEAALKSSVAREYLRMAGYYKKPRKVRTNSPSSQQLASLNLKEGSNKITFTFETRVWGKQQVDARIYLWRWTTRIVISDVDGTITKSDVLGQVMPLMGRDWTQIGVAKLFSAIKKNGYELLFLSARAISQAYLTRQFLENIKQDGEALPDGPMVISPDGLFPSLYREVIRRAPHEFKIACLEDIKSLFPPESKPFYAGFGNRDTDELSYLKVGISKGKIFIINPKGEVAVNNQVDVKSYTSLHKLVDDMFPAMTFTEQALQEDYNEWNFWKLPLPDVDDEPSVKSVGSSSSRRSGKSGK